MEEYFIKMYTDPEVVLAVTEHIVEYFYQANKLLFEKASQYIDVFFFGNDFGTQLDLLISPAMFEKFVYPGTKRLVDLAKSYDLKVALHSCGSIYKVIPLLIDAGIDVIHPIQAKAANMNAELLMKEFGEKVVFMGGVDTQDLLPFGSEKEVEQEVKRLMKVFGSNYIVSPSHEALLKNVTTKNLLAMARSVK
jgi:uroporphyrinogen decarboxylase